MAASINVSEDDFMAVAGAAKDAQARNDDAQAVALDKVARKINAALTGADPHRKIATMMGAQPRPVRWRDMPSALNNPAHGRPVPAPDGE